MITPSEKKDLKAVIGHRYALQIQADLNKHQKFNKKNSPYTVSQIANVMNGQPHAIIEEAIYRVYKNVLRKAKKQKALLKQKNNK